MGAAVPGQSVYDRWRSYFCDPKQLPQVLVGSLLARYWSHQPSEAGVGLPHSPSLAPSDNLQTPMNLVMPLRYPHAAYRAQFGKLLFNAADEVLSGLNNVGTVHFARFDIIQGNLCMFSVYDGDFQGYIRDFIGTIGGVFDGLMTFVKEPPRAPCGEYVDEFIEWVHGHDMLQMPEWPTDISDDLPALQRSTLVLFDRNANMQMGMYHGYPGYSVAQIRNGLGIGW
ncbi:MAG TPA: hypothetical protein VHT75_19990 [Acidimicrobiales bacterium]|jgi:hypothetical protein|nr:hypothetical protein [Acidimicrobiales bacterium]